MSNRSTKQDETSLHADLGYVADEQFEGDKHVVDFLKNRLGQAQYEGVVICLEKPQDTALDDGACLTESLLDHGEGAIDEAGNVVLPETFS